MSHVERELNRLNDSASNQTADDEEIELEPVTTEIPSIQYDLKPPTLFDESPRKYRVSRKKLQRLLRKIQPFNIFLNLLQYVGISSFLAKNMHKCLFSKHFGDKKVKIHPYAIRYTRI